MSYSNPHRLLKEWIRSAFRMQQQTSWRPHNPQWHSSTKTFASTMRGKQIRRAKSINCVHSFIAYLCWHALCQHIFVNKKNSIVPYRLLIPLLGGVCWTRRKYGVNNAGMFFFSFHRRTMDLLSSFCVSEGRGLLEDLELQLFLKSNFYFATNWKNILPSCFCPLNLAGIIGFLTFSSSINLPLIEARL